MMSRFVRLATLCVLVAACSGSTGTRDSGGSKEALQMLETHAGQVMRLRPSYATRMGLMDEDLGIRVNDAMDDYSSDHMRQWRRTIYDMRNELRALPEGELNSLTLRAMDDIYSGLLGARDVPFGFIDTFGRHRPYIINQIDQPLQEIPKMLTHFQRLESREDVADYLRRLWALSNLVDTVLEKFNKDASAGWLPPRPILEGALVYLEGFTSVPPHQHVLVTTLEEKMADIEELSEEDRAKARNEAIAVLLRVVYPAYANAVVAVQERLPRAREQAGIWAQPLGEQFYARAIINEAGSPQSADEIHELGLAEVERILAEMDAGLDALGMTRGSVAERMQALAREEQFKFADSDAGRAELLARVEGLVVDMQGRLPDYFGRLPEESVVVRRVPPELEAGAAMGFYDGPPASGGPGTFWLNMRSMEELTWFSMPTLTYHETVPGHHLQVALSRSQGQKPLLWRYTINSGYSEGWALYSELLAAEMGVYEDDPYGDLGRLQDELMRAVRLVVDTGLHHKRWSMGKAITYFIETTGKGEQEVRAEVVRYMAWPGQALSYKLGMLASLDMRADAERALGEAYSISDFHDVVLGTGQVSMPVLRDEVKAWWRSAEN